MGEKLVRRGAVPMAGVRRGNHRVARPDFLGFLAFELCAAGARPALRGRGGRWVGEGGDGGAGALLGVGVGRIGWKGVARRVVTRVASSDSAPLEEA